MEHEALPKAAEANLIYAWTGDGWFLKRLPSW
jgi:hypothetical protein